MQAFATRLTAHVESLEDAHNCRIGLAVTDMKSGARAGWRDRELFHPASVIKIAVMIETFHQAAEGHFALSDTLVANPEFESMLDGSPYTTEARPFLAERLGQPVEILTLAEQMMVVSDNLATNLLITLCGPRRITATMRSLGAADGFVVRCLQDEEAFRAGISNRLSPADVEAMLRLIETPSQKFPDPESAAGMRRILLAQEFNEMIPRHLPAGVRVGHKTGSITAVHHDAGIVYTDDGPYVLAIFTEGIEDKEVSSGLVADLALHVHTELEALRGGLAAGSSR